MHGGETKEEKAPQAEERGSPLSKQEFLSDLADELHKPVRRNFPTRHVFASAKDSIWALDLADMSHWKADNDNYTMILTCVDVFTRWADARAIKTKSATEVLAALKSIVSESKRQPEKLWTDAGTEFTNKIMTKWRDEHGIGMYHTYSPHKASVVEAFNKTLKTMMWKDADHIEYA